MSDLRDMARRRGLSQHGDRPVLARRLRDSCAAAARERARLQQEERRRAAAAELAATAEYVPSRSTNYDLTETRSGVARQGRPVARAAVRRASLDDVEA